MHCEVVAWFCIPVCFLPSHISFCVAPFLFPPLLQGLIVSSRLESLQHFKKPWAHEYEPVKELVDAVNVWTLSLSLFTYVYLSCLLKLKFLLYGLCFVFCQEIKPTILIGTSGQGRTFTKEVVEAMASLNEVHCMIFCFLSLLEWGTLHDFFKKKEKKSMHLQMKRLTQLSYVWLSAETHYLFSFQPNFTIWMHCRRSLYVEPGNPQHISYHQGHHVFTPIFRFHIVLFYIE